MTKTKGQLRAEAVERLVKLGEVGFYYEIIDALCDADCDDWSGDKVASAIRDLLTDDDANDGSAPEKAVTPQEGRANDGKADSREKLEADACEYVRGIWSKGRHDEQYRPDSILPLLDRQAAITSREVHESWAIQEKEEIGRLRAEVDEWKSAHAGACEKFRKEHYEDNLRIRGLVAERDEWRERYIAESWHSGHQRMELARLNARLGGHPEPPAKLVGNDGKPIKRGQTLYGGDGRAWKVERFDGKYLWTENDGKRLRPEWLAHERPDSIDRILDDMSELIGNLRMYGGKYAGDAEAEADAILERARKLAKEGA